jgi:acyl dehydratase
MKMVSEVLIGRQLKSTRWSWGPEEAMLYALGVGAEPDRDLAFLYEGAGPAVLPTFGSVPTGAEFLSIVEQLGLDLRSVLHAEQSLTLHRPLPSSASAIVRRRVAHVWDKGTGALVVIDEDGNDGAPLFSARSSWWIKGAGGFGGARGPSVAAGAEPPTRAPDLVRDRTIGWAQAALYRLSGDCNPIHIDPAFARSAGFDRPFLHGLCTYGMVALELVAEMCAGDPHRLRELHARFTAPVFPGDELTIEMWISDGEAEHLRARVADRVVIANGRARIAA